jgi:catechol 2,3-dioxygenase-like lactoylglutathione lyase family enzyme
VISYAGLATARFDEVVKFYGDLGFRKVRGWDRPDGRGVVLQLQDLHLELLDATREKYPMRLEPPGDRFHVVLEVADVNAVRQTLTIQSPEPVETSWGARLLKFRDPDGIRVWFLQWLRDPAAPR